MPGAWGRLLEFCLRPGCARFPDSSHRLFGPANHRIFVNKSVVLAELSTTYASIHPQDVVAGRTRGHNVWELQRRAQGDFSNFLFARGFRDLASLPAEVLSSIS